ncbi:MAG TPA: hypothetical protein VEB18_03765 [Candidatus Paceibacterota bacterium]|nr:hypothetical protein [Candidatus Paceibacterota bacterium]
MGFRNTLIWIGAILLLGSWYFGDLAIVIGAPLLFMGMILKYLEIS